MKKYYIQVLFLQCKCQCSCLQMNLSYFYFNTQNQFFLKSLALLMLLFQIGLKCKSSSTNFQRNSNYFSIIRFSTLVLGTSYKSINLSAVDVCYFYIMKSDTHTHIQINAYFVCIELVGEINHHSFYLPNYTISIKNSFNIYHNIIENAMIKS